LDAHRDVVVRQRSRLLVVRLKFVARRLRSQRRLSTRRAFSRVLVTASQRPQPQCRAPAPAPPEAVCQGQAPATRHWSAQNSTEAGRWGAWRGHMRISVLLQKRSREALAADLSTTVLQGATWSGIAAPARQLPGVSGCVNSHPASMQHCLFSQAAAAPPAVTRQSGAEWRWRPPVVHCSPHTGTPHRHGCAQPEAQ
jgi:hypothetical protein